MLSLTLYLLLPPFLTGAAGATFRSRKPIRWLGSHVLGVVRACQPTMLSPLPSEIFESSWWLFWCRSEDSIEQIFEYAGGLFSFRDVLPGWILASHFIFFFLLPLITSLVYFVFVLYFFFSFSWLILSLKIQLILEYTICQAMFYFPCAFILAT